MNLKAIILAAGYATRLHPLTKNKSKCLIEVKGKSMAQHIIDKLQGITGLDWIFIVTNKKFNVDFELYASEAKSKIPISVINDQTESNDDRLGAIGDIVYAIEEAGIDDDILVVAGDNLFEFSLKKFALFAQGKKASCVAARKFASKGEIAGKFGVLEIDTDSRIVGFEEKPDNPKTKIGATACYFFTKEDCSEILDYARKKLPLDNSGEFIKYLSAKKPVYAFIFREKWYDIGCFEDLGKAREEFKADSRLS